MPPVQEEDAPLLLHADAPPSPGPGAAASAPPQLAARPSAKAETGGALQVEARSGSTAAAMHAAAIGMPWGITAGEAPQAGHRGHGTATSRRSFPVDALPPCPPAGLLLTDMVGIGSLAMPSVFARLGWLVS